MPDEYAKIIKWTALNSVRGMKATVTLPSPASNTRVGGDGSGFINFYLGMSLPTGSGELSYECGLSTSSGHASRNEWHWFTNTSDGEGSIGGDWEQFHADDTINIMLELNGSQLSYSVNEQRVRTFSKSFSGNLSNGRFIIAACHADYRNKTIPNPLPAWDVTHNQVTVSNLQYKNVNNRWISLNSSNSTPPNGTIKWPEGTAHQGTPQNYSLSVQPWSSLMYASLKK